MQNVRHVVKKDDKEIELPEWDSCPEIEENKPFKLVDSQIITAIGSQYIKRQGDVFIPITEQEAFDLVFMRGNDE